MPELWEAEVLNGLTVLKRGGLLDLEAALRAWSNASDLLRGRGRKCDPPAVLRTADRDGLAGHFVNKARREGRA